MSLDATGTGAHVVDAAAVEQVGLPPVLGRSVVGRSDWSMSCPCHVHVHVHVHDGRPKTKTHNTHTGTWQEKELKP